MSTHYAKELVSRLRKRFPDEYITWKHLRQRCNNPNDKSWKNYGGRGIKVCARWDYFPNFIADIGAKPGPAYVIDRINNDGNYEPDNIRWTSRTVSSRNRRKRRLLTWKGETHCLTEWEEITGIKYTTLMDRMLRKWPVGEIFTTPKQSGVIKNAPRYTHNGKTQTAGQWAKEAGISYSLLWKRLKK